MHEFFINPPVLQRATGVLSTVLPQSSEAVQHAIQGDVVQTMRRLLKVHNVHTTVSVNISTLFCIILLEWYFISISIPSVWLAIWF